MVRDVREALTRKLGPLPVWAWTLIAAAAVFVYRVRGGLAGGAPIPSYTADTPATERADRDTLEPGESIYDPDTGQLIGTPGAPRDPIVLSPGESIYDPNTGELIGTAPDQTTGESPTPDAAEPPVNAPLAPLTVAVTKGSPGVFDRIKRDPLRNQAGKQIHTVAEAETLPTFRAIGTGGGRQKHATPKDKPSRSRDQHVKKPAHEGGKGTEKPRGAATTKPNAPRAGVIRVPIPDTSKSRNVGKIVQVNAPKRIPATTPVKGQPGHLPTIPRTQPTARPAATKSAAKKKKK